MKKKDIFVIIINIAAGIVDITGGIIYSNFDRFMVGILFLILAFSIYVFTRGTNVRDDYIKLLEEHIEKQDKLLLDAIKELANPNVIIDLNDIKIPEKFTKPRKEKLNSRIEYYNKNKRFEVPIILDPSNMLIDGYTSYLIAKKYNMKTVQAKVKIGGETSEIFIK